VKKRACQSKDMGGLFAAKEGKNAVELLYNKRLRMLRRNDGVAGDEQIAAVG
jgi:hypothetical protein